MNLLDADGFQISLNMNLESLGETFRISKKELNSNDTVKVKIIKPYKDGAIAKLI